MTPADLSLVTGANLRVRTQISNTVTDDRAFEAAALRALKRSDQESRALRRTVERLEAENMALRRARDEAYRLAIRVGHGE